MSAKREQVNIACNEGRRAKAKVKIKISTSVLVQTTEKFSATLHGLAANVAAGMILSASTMSSLVSLGPLLL